MVLRGRRSRQVDARASITASAIQTVLRLSREAQTRRSTRQRKELLDKLWDDTRQLYCLLLVRDVRKPFFEHAN